MSLSTRATALLASVFLSSGSLVACHDVHFQARGGPGVIDIYDDLYTVAAPDDKLVIAGGYWGAIYRSEDGGQTWVKSDSGTKMLIYDISMADDRFGWAVGQLGLVLRTEDGGKTWVRQSTPKDEQGVHLFAIAAISPMRAVAVGEYGTRLLTNDGGKSWRDDSLTISEDHPQFVWLSPFDQARVREGKKVFEDVSLNDVSCLPAAPNHCWIIGEFAYLFRSDDGGETWERGEILSGIKLDPIPLAFNTIEIPDEQADKIREFAEQIADLQHLNVAIEPRVSDAEIKALVKPGDPFPLFELVEARTQEVQSVIEEAGILSDRIRRRGAPPWDYEDFIKDDPDFLKRWIESRRAKQPSIEVQIAQNPYLFSVDFADADHGYISGLGGVVLRSEDGGRTFRYEDVGQKVALFALHAFDPKKVMVVGEKGVYRETTDGAVDWFTPGGFPSIFTFMRDVNFARDNQVGYIVGQNGMILRTADGSATWTQVLPKPDTKVATAD